MEKRTPLSIVTGVLYIVAGLAGIAIAVVGLYLAWFNHANVVKNVSETTALAGRAITATSDTIDVVQDSLDKASENLDLINSMTDGLATSLDASQGLIDATAGLIGNDLVGLFEETQSSLGEVEKSAETVDEALAVINRIQSTLSDLRSLIPFASPAPRENSLPAATMKESVAKVRASLEPVPDSLKGIEREISVSAANVATMQAEVEQLTDELVKIEASLEDAHTVAGEYRDLLNDLQQRFDRFENNLPAAIRAIYVGLTILLAWIFLSQAAMLLHGIHLLFG